VEKTRAGLQLVPGCPCGRIDSWYLWWRLAVLAFARRDVELYALPIGSGARAFGQFGHV
jgi:hypothetical protein